MSWQVLKDNPSLQYDKADKDVDFSNVYYHYFAYNSEDIALMLQTALKNAVAEQSYFGSGVLALLNSLGGTNRLVKNIFFDQATFQSYVNTAKAQNVSLPDHVKAKATGSTTLGTIITDGVDTITKTVSNVADSTTKNLLGFRLSSVMPLILIVGLSVAGIYLYKTYGEKVLK